MKLRCMIIIAYVFISLCFYIIAHYSALSSVKRGIMPVSHTKIFLVLKKVLNAGLIVNKNFLGNRMKESLTYTLKITNTRYFSNI